MVDDLFRSRIARRQFNMLLIGLFGLLGLAIASIGVYGVMAYVVAQRTNEIGIHIALGALPKAIMRSVLERASAHVALGVTISMGGAWLLGGLVASFLFGVAPHDLVVYAGALVVLLIASLVAAFIPARRAARVDPLVALRYE